MMDIPPILILVAAGFFLKKAGAVRKEFADSLINLIFYVFLPATLFYSLTRVETGPNAFTLVVCGFLVAVFSYGCGYLAAKAVKADKKTAGPLIMMAGAMNQAFFTYPFFLLYNGAKGVSSAAFFDLGQAVLSLTFAYHIAACYGGGCVDYKRSLRNIMRFPAIWALGLALGMNYFHLTDMTQPIDPVIEFLNNATAPLVMLAIGVFLEPKISKPKPMAAVLFIRFAASLGFAYLLTLFFGLTGLEQKIVLVASAAPPAVLTLIYSTNEKLDTEYTAATISTSILIGLAYIPLLFAIL